MYFPNHHPKSVVLALMHLFWPVWLRRTACGIVLVFVLSLKHLVFVRNCSSAQCLSTPIPFGGQFRPPLQSCFSEIEKTNHSSWKNRRAPCSGQEDEGRRHNQGPQRHMWRVQNFVQVSGVSKGRLCSPKEDFLKCPDRRLGLYEGSM